MHPIVNKSIKLIKQADLYIFGYNLYKAISATSIIKILNYNNKIEWKIKSYFKLFFLNPLKSFSFDLGEYFNTLLLHYTLNKINRFY